VPSFSYMIYYLVVVSIHPYPLNFAPADGHTRLGKSHPPFAWNLHGHTMYADIPWLTWFVTFHWAYAGAMHIDFHFLSLGECKILLQVGSKVFPWMTQNADAMRSMQVCAPSIDDCLIFFIGEKNKLLSWETPWIPTVPCASPARLCARFVWPPT